MTHVSLFIAILKKNQILKGSLVRKWILYHDQMQITGPVKKECWRKKP